MKSVQETQHLPARRFGAATFALITLAAAVPLAGCGSHGESRAPSQPEAQASVAAPAEQSSPVPKQPGMPPGNAGASEPSATRSDSLPPDIAVSLGDTLVTPGETVELTAEGTPDVVEVTLWDGVHERLAFTRDAEGNTWRVEYRVPLQLNSERLGLSVTAKNEAGRWRRVWLFLKLRDGASETRADSTSSS